MLTGNRQVWALVALAFCACGSDEDGGTAAATPDATLLTQMGFLVRQEIPRNIIPVVLTLLIMVLSWFTPLGPVLTFIGPLAAVVFLAWDNTDLIPARNLVPFGRRFKSLGKTLLFHVGFGLPFLVPVLNLLFLSFAPVGATLYHLDREKVIPHGKKEAKPETQHRRTDR